MFERKALGNKFTVISIAVLLLTGLLSLFICRGHAQAQPAWGIEWFKTFGGQNSEIGWSVRQTSDGGYIVCGSKWSDETASYDIWLLKTDASGDLLWDRTFDSGGDDEGFSVQQTTDGGYVLCGTRGTASVWLIKTDDLGDLEWDMTYGEPSSGSCGRAVEQTSDGGYIITGVANDDVLLLKTDAGGQEEWSKTFGKSGYLDEGWSIQQCVDGGYVIASSTESYGAGSSEVWLIKTDSLGVKEWDRTFGSPLAEYGRSVEQTEWDGGFVIAGYATSQGGDTDVWLIKTDSLGHMLWDRRFGDPDRSEAAYSVEETTDLGYIVAGASSAGTQGHPSVWLIKTDLSGGMEWGLMSLGDDYATSVRQTVNGGYIIAGGTKSFASGSDDVLLLKISAPPNQPVNAYPPRGASLSWSMELGQDLVVILRSSPFSDPDSGDTHWASQWQITTTPGYYSSPVFDSGTDYTNLIAITVPLNHLRLGTTYYWHVRYQDNYGAWSDYSVETEFDTHSKLLGEAAGGLVQMTITILAAFSRLLTLGLPY